MGYSSYLGHESYNIDVKFNSYLLISAIKLLVSVVSVVEPVAMILTPRLANACAQLNPMPRDEPVINATLVTLLIFFLPTQLSVTQQFHSSLLL